MTLPGPGLEKMKISAPNTDSGGNTWSEFGPGSRYKPKNFRIFVETSTIFAIEKLAEIISPSLVSQNQGDNAGGGGSFLTWMLVFALLCIGGLAFLVFHFRRKLLNSMDPFPVVVYVHKISGFSKNYENHDFNVSSYDGPNESAILPKTEYENQLYGMPTAPEIHSLPRNGKGSYNSYTDDGGGSSSNSDKFGPMTSPTFEDDDRELFIIWELLLWNGECLSFIYAL